MTFKGQKSERNDYKDKEHEEVARRQMTRYFSNKKKMSRSVLYIGDLYIEVTFIDRCPVYRGNLYRQMSFI